MERSLGLVDLLRMPVYSSRHSTGSDRWEKEIVCIVGSDLSDWINDQEKQLSKNTLAPSGIRVVRYEELLENAYANYAVYIRKSEQANRLIKLIQSLDPEEEFRPDAEIAP